MNEIDLMKFCSSDIGLKKLGTPWTAGDWTYASDGRVMIRVPRRDEVTRRDGPPMTNIGWPHASLNDWEDLPLFPKTEWKECHVCSGSIRVDAPVKFGERYINSYYLELISTLPNVRASRAGRHAEPMMFRFDGGEGQVMPMVEGVKGIRN